MGKDKKKQSNVGIIASYIAIAASVVLFVFLMKMNENEAAKQVQAAQDATWKEIAETRELTSRMEQAKLDRERIYQGLFRWGDCVAVQEGNFFQGFLGTAIGYGAGIGPVGGNCRSVKLQRMILPSGCAAFDPSYTIEFCVNELYVVDKAKCEATK